MKTNPLGWNLENSYLRLPELFYSRMNPRHVEAPALVIFNESLADALGLHGNALQTEVGVAVFAGNQVPEGTQPLAQAYAGHQFGHFAMLGDGRALLIGEQLTPSGDRFDIQLKGSGRTPYSRRGDGLAALGPMLREYVISEAMHALGIPTTRSLAVVTTGEPVYRETEWPGAVLTRIAASHIRVGTFQYAAQWGTLEDIRALADYTIQRHYPEVVQGGQRYLQFLESVIRRQAELLAKWQLVGFIHGVMNTDNMAISGETIDYGPCAFMDAYDPQTVFSSIDVQGRYAYENQPYLAAWNLARLAESILPLLHEDADQAVKLAEAALRSFSSEYQEQWLAGMRAKLGIFNEESEDESIIHDLLKLMHQHRADFTNTFRALTFDRLIETGMSTIDEFQVWHTRWAARRTRQSEDQVASHQLMRSSNPAVIPRNHRVEEALQAAVNQGDYQVMHELLAVLRQPFAHSERQTEYATLPASCDEPYQTFCGT